MYSIVFKKSFAKDLSLLPKFLDTKIKQFLEQLKTNPYEKCIKLKGFKQIYRLRLGDYRLLYKIDDNEKLITLLAIAHRKDIYKKFNIV